MYWAALKGYEQQRKIRSNMVCDDAHCWEYAVGSYMAIDMQNICTLYCMFAKP